MATVHASFDRWWNGISLRAKITGVTVLLLTFGLVVAGAGTMTVLRNYLFDQVDAKVDSLRTSALQLLSQSPSTIEDCGVGYKPYGYLFAVLGRQRQAVVQQRARRRRRNRSFAVQPWPR